MQNRLTAASKRDRVLEVFLAAFDGCERPAWQDANRGVILHIEKSLENINMAMTAAARGLEEIVAADSGICWIDGDAGILAYRGIDIHELAEKSTFPETAYLLWFGTSAFEGELAEFRQHLARGRVLPPEVVRLMEDLPRKSLADGSAAHRCLRAEHVRRR